MIWELKLVKYNQLAFYHGPIRNSKPYKGYHPLTWIKFYVKLIIFWDVCKHNVKTKTMYASQCILITGQCDIYLRKITWCYSFMFTACLWWFIANEHSETDGVNWGWKLYIWPAPDRDNTICVIIGTPIKLILCIHRVFNVRDNHSN